MAKEKSRVKPETQANEPFPRWMTAVQAMSYMQISRSSFVALVKAKVIPVKPLTARILRYDREQIDLIMGGDKSSISRADDPLKTWKENRRKAKDEREKKVLSRRQNNKRGG